MTTNVSRCKPRGPDPNERLPHPVSLNMQPADTYHRRRPLLQSDLTHRGAAPMPLGSLKQEAPPARGGKALSRHCTAARQVPAPARRSAQHTLPPRNQSRTTPRKANSSQSAIFQINPSGLSATATAREHCHTSPRFFLMILTSCNVRRT